MQKQYRQFSFDASSLIIKFSQDLISCSEMTINKIVNKLINITFTSPVIMKIAPNKLLKTTSSKLKFHEQKEVLQQCGTNLCIRSIIPSRSIQPDFITIGQSTPFTVQPVNQDDLPETTVIKLYDYISSNTHKNIFTAQCIQNHQNQNKSIEICSYSLREMNNESATGIGYRAERKCFKLSQISGYIPEQRIENIYFVPDYYNNSLLYVITQTRDMECYHITLIDMSKMKMIAHGFIPCFSYATVSHYEDGQISILGNNNLKRIKLQQKEQSFSIVQEKLPKKLQLNNVNILKHHWLGYDKLLLATSNSIYITQGQNNSLHEIVSTITVLDEDSQQTQIVQILVLNKSILVFLQNLDILVYNEDREDGNLKYQLAEITKMSKFFDSPPELHDAGLKFVQVEITKNMEELMVGLSNGEYYYSRYQQLELGSEQNHFSFEKIPFKFYTPKQGQIFAATGQNFCLITTDNAIEIWDLQKIILVNRMEFQISGLGKTVSKCALHPDGHSICVVFPDRIRFYRILINKFKQYSEVYIGKCQVIQYCHGGHLIACSSSKTSGPYVSIIDTLKFKQICSFKISYAPQHIVWNEHDDTIFVSTKKIHTVNIFKILSQTKQDCVCLSGPIQMMRFDYASKNLIITLENGSVIATNSQGEISVLDLQIKGLYTVFPSQGMYFASNKFGKLYYSSHLNFDRKYELSLFDKPFKMHYRKGCLVAYTDVSNILLLKVKVPQKSETQIVKQTEIEDIMLVEKEEIVKLFEKTKYLESQFQQLQNLTTVKLDEERKRYNEDLEKLSRDFQKEVEEIKKQNVDLQVESTKNNKYSERMFDELETGQIRSVNQLEKVYDLKIKLQKQRYLALQQENMEQKMRYQTMISKIQENYHNDIQKVRKQYSTKLEQKSKQVDAWKANQMGFQKKLQTRLVDMEQQNQLTLFQLQNKKDTNIKNLIEKNTKLEREYDSVMIELHNMKQEYEELKNQNEKNKDKLKRNQRSVNQNFNRVIVLQKQLSNRDKMIEQKNITIEQQAHQISQLQKSKYVLTFRTFEIRKTLEPKDELIEKLKSNLLKLEEESKEEKKSKFEIEKSAEKYMKILQSLRKESQELKIAHKNIVMFHRNLCSDIYTVMNNIDPKQRNTHFVEIYQKYVKEQNVNSRANSTFKSDPTSQQINRHLIHVEQSLQQVAQGNEKMLQGKKKEVQKKMKQNAELLYEINIMRKKLREYEKKIEEKDIEISKLIRENKQTREMHKSTRANTAQTGFTRRIPTRDPSSSVKNNNELLDLSIRRQSDYLIPDRKGARSRVVSAHKTMMMRDDSKKDRSKISDMARELQTAKNTVRRQQKLIDELNQRLFAQLE